MQCRFAKGRRIALAGSAQADAARKGGGEEKRVARVIDRLRIGHRPSRGQAARARATQRCGPLAAAIARPRTRRDVIRRFTSGGCAPYCITFNGASHTTRGHGLINVNGPPRGRIMRKCNTGAFIRRGSIVH